MSTQFFSALVSLACLFYAKYLNSISSKELSDDEYKDRLNDVTFFTLFGLFTMLVSFI
jgi:hypothetical protein